MCIFIGGPTASGKTALSLKLAKLLGCEILSADSRQIYKELNIGVAKPSQEELDQIHHYGINITSIHEPFSAGQFEAYALEVIHKTAKANDFLIITGGTGLYLNSVLFGLDKFPEVPEYILDMLSKELNETGLANLVKELKELDPDYANIVDQDNSRRVIRALSVIHTTGKAYSSFLNQPKPKRPFQSKGFYIQYPREELYDRINQRVDKMIADGLVKEARSLKSYKNIKPLQTVGYQELFRYLKTKWISIRPLKKLKRIVAAMQNARLHGLRINFHSLPLWLMIGTIF